MSLSVTCWHCRTAIAAPSRFCPDCGAAVSVEALTTASGTSAGQQPPSPFDRGRAALRAGEVDRAIPLLADAAAAGDGPALFAYGTALLRRRRHAAALDPLARAVEALPDRGEPLAYLAMARLHTLDLAGARLAMNRAVSTAPESFVVRLKHTEMLMRLGYYREALTEARVTLGLTAPDAETLAFAERLADLARQRAPQSYTREPGRLPRLGIGRLLGRLGALRQRGTSLPRPTAQ